MVKRKIQDIEEVIPPEPEAIIPIKQLEILRNWRKDKIADVDIFGCDKLAEPTADAKVKEYDSFGFRFNSFLDQKVSYSR